MRASFRLRLSPLVALLLASFALPAFAESDPCKGPKPTGAEAVKLEAAVSHAIGNRRIPDLDIKDVHICHLGGGKISVLLESSRTRNNDGVKQWWILRCGRGWPERQWNCQSPEQREAIELRAPLGGIERTVDLTPTADIPVGTARDLALRSIALVEDPAAAPPRCASDRPEDRITWNNMRQSRIKPAYPGGRPTMRLQTQGEELAPGATRVVLYEGLAIEYPSRCFYTWPAIIVTE